MPDAPSPPQEGSSQLAHEHRLKKVVTAHHKRRKSVHSEGDIDIARIHLQSERRHCGMCKQNYCPNIVLPEVAKRLLALKSLDQIPEEGGL